MKILFCLTICIPLLANAQYDKGIYFERDGSLKQIMEIAKKQNKSVFIDCFTTWCGPCKRMDKEVYVNDSVGKYFNSKLISMKVQMNKTANDDEFVKRRYEDAQFLEKKYKVTAFPTYIFFNSLGEIVFQETGFKGVNEFILLAKRALEPGRKFVNVYQAYDSLVERYYQGEKNYSKMPYLIKMAEKLNDTALVALLSSDYSGYLHTIGHAKLYQKDIIDYLSSAIRASNDDFFFLFYQQGKRIDRVMNRKGYARNVVDRVVRLEETGPALMASQGKFEPDWDSLYRSIKRKYSSDNANRGVAAAKLRWYEFNEKWPEYTRDFIQLVEKYGIDVLEIYRNLLVHPEEQPEVAIDATLNWFASTMIVERSEDATQIDFAIKYMKGVVDRSLSRSVYFAHATRDTYANLLFKARKWPQAIKMEEEALQYATTDQDTVQIVEYKKRLEEMYRSQLLSK